MSSCSSSYLVEAVLLCVVLNVGVDSNDEGDDKYFGLLMLKLDELWSKSVLQSMVIFCLLFCLSILFEDGSSRNLQGEDEVDDGEVVELFDKARSLLFSVLPLLFELVASEEDSDENEVSDEVISALLPF